MRAIDFAHTSPRSRRRLFASVSVLSLILCLATVGLWVRSYYTSDVWNKLLPGARTLQLYTEPGRISAVRARIPNDTVRGNRWDHYTHSALPSAAPTFVLERTGNGGSGLAIPGWSLVVPTWLPAILFALAPAWWLL